MSERRCKSCGKYSKHMQSGVSMDGGCRDMCPMCRRSAEVCKLLAMWRPICTLIPRP